MKSWTKLKSLGVSITGITSTTEQTLLNEFINDSIRVICSMRGGRWAFLEDTQDVLTVANQSPYQTPNKFRKIMSLYVTVGSGTTAVKYLPTPILDDEMWNLVLASRLAASDVALFYRVQGDNVYMQPAPATSSNTLTFRGRVKVRDLSLDDYTTGTIVSVANGGTAVVGAGTAWTADMVGRYIQITETSAALGGDGFWYEIAAVGSATTLTLAKPYLGTAITGAAAVYTIGQMSVLPEEYDIAPLYRAVALYFDLKQNQQLSKRYWGLYDGGNEAGMSKNIGGMIGQMVDSVSETVESNYISPTRIRQIDPNLPPQNLSGF